MHLDPTPGHGTSASIYLRGTTEVPGRIDLSILFRAVSLAATRRCCVDPSFTDILSPGSTDGRSLAQAAIQRLLNVRILFATGYARDAAALRGRLADGAELLAKSFSAVDLANTVKHQLDKQG